MSALAILHPVITVSDINESLAFYRDLLGLKVTDDYHHDPAHLAQLLGVPDPDVRAVVLQCPDGSELELAEFRRPRGTSTAQKRFEDAGLTFVSIVVDDIDIIVERLLDGGYSTHGPIVDYPWPDPGMRVVYCFGPDRTPITLAQRLKPTEK